MSTTETHQVDAKNIIAALNQCIEICIDGERGYAEAAAGVRDLELKAFFHDESKQRGEFAGALQTIVRRLGATPEREGTAKGTMHRGWMNVRSLSPHGGDRAIVAEWVRGERAAVKGYRDALQRTPLDMLPADIRGVVQAQYSEIRESLGAAMRRLELGY